jgi:plasmid stabilization system protein ParE
MNWTIVIAEQAHRDIERNAVWWANRHSIRQALAWQDLVYQQLAEIAHMPESYPLSPENGRVPVELRQKSVGLGRGGYRAIFSIQGTEIRILAVRRAAQDALHRDDLAE